jgi:hypothetical protein
MKPSPPVIKIIAIALGSGLVADLLTIDELEKRALAVVQKIEDELEAELQGQVESYLEMMNSNRQFLHRDGALTTAECCSRSTDQLAPTMERIGSSETT